MRDSQIKCPCKTCCDYKKPLLLPDGLKNMFFENYKTTTENIQAFDKAKEFVSDLTSSLYIYGNPGNGKTHLLVSALHEVMKTQCSYKYAYFHSSKLVKIKRDAFETQEEAQLRLVEKISKKKFVFIDDFASEATTPETVELLCMIINDGIENRKTKFFITGNKSISFLSKQVSDRIASRIGGLCGKANVVKNLAKDFRLE